MFCFSLFCSLRCFATALDSEILRVAVDFLVGLIWREPQELQRHADLRPLSLADTQVKAPHSSQTYLNRPLMLHIPFLLYCIRKLIVWKNKLSILTFSYSIIFSTNRAKGFIAGPEQPPSCLIIFFIFCLLDRKIRNLESLHYNKDILLC